MTFDRPIIEFCNPDGSPEFDDHFQNLRLKSDFAQIDATRSALRHQLMQRKQRADRLRNRRCHACCSDTETKNSDKQQIKQNIDDRCDYQIIDGMLAVA